MLSILIRKITPYSWYSFMFNIKSNDFSLFDTIVCSAKMYAARYLNLTRFKGKLFKLEHVINLKPNSPMTLRGG